jgi:hypothetical protein
MSDVDLMAIKREGQTEVQHPIYSPMYEQWEGFIQHLTNQQVRQATVKTADGRLGVIWAEKTKDPNLSKDDLEENLSRLIQKSGYPFQKVYEDLVSDNRKTQTEEIFAY